jgi:uncharacterized protein (TIGR00106 family)
MEERNVLVEFSMTPLDKGESVSTYVARSLEIIETSGIPYRLNPMGTVLEGTYAEVMGVIEQCFQKMKIDCNRITTSIKIDYRKGKTDRLNSKIQSVEQKVGKKLAT